MNVSPGDQNQLKICEIMNYKKTISWYSAGCCSRDLLRRTDLHAELLHRVVALPGVPEHSSNVVFPPGINPIWVGIHACLVPKSSQVFCGTLIRSIPIVFVKGAELPSIVIRHGVSYRYMKDSVSNRLDINYLLTCSPAGHLQASKLKLDMSNYFQWVTHQCCR